MNKHGFKKWFKKQFGHRVSNKSLEYHREQVNDAFRVYEREKNLYEKIKAYDDLMDDSLKAWNAGRTP